MKTEPERATFLKAWVLRVPFRGHVHDALGIYLGHVRRKSCVTGPGGLVLGKNAHMDVPSDFG